MASTAEVEFTDATDVDEFFQNRKGGHYIRWFNAELSGRGPWADVRLVDTPLNDIGFHQFWNQTARIFGGPASLLQYICLMSILSNEVRGDFTPAAERMGSAGHPGMAYLFDRIPGRKRSYNTLAGNQTALDCFGDESYVAAHGSLPLGTQLAHTSDARWAGETWPPEFAADQNPAVSGFVTQADFMKFRGRGFIQTTGRTNYLPLIKFVQDYAGGNSTLDFYQLRWRGKTAERICFESTNADWDSLFQQTDLILATEAVRVHNLRSGNYLQLSAAPAVQNGTGPGSVFYMGKRISGGDSYAAKFKDRVAATLAAI